MPFKKTLQKSQTKNQYKHVCILVGYEFKNKTIKQTKEWLSDNDIHFNDDSNIYVDDDTVMY